MEQEVKQSEVLIKDPSKMTLLEKLAKIRDLVDVAAKDKRGFNYKYIDISPVIAAMHGGMNNYHVSLYPMLNQQTFCANNIELKTIKPNPKTGQVQESLKNETRVTGWISYVWVNDDNPEDKLEVPWVYIGQQEDPSQSFGAAMTYSMRQFLVHFFQIAQVEDDVETYVSAKKEAQNKENIEISNGFIKKIDVFVAKLVQDAGGKETDKGKSVMANVLKIAKKYINGGNYRKIDDPTSLMSLLDELTKAFAEKKDDESANENKKK